MQNDDSTHNNPTEDNPRGVDPMGDEVKEPATGTGRAVPGLGAGPVRSVAGRRPRKLSRGARVTVAAASLGGVLAGAGAMALTAELPDAADRPVGTDPAAAGPARGEFAPRGDLDPRTDREVDAQGISPDCPPWQDAPPAAAGPQGSPPAPSRDQHGARPGSGWYEDDDDHENHEDHEDHEDREEHEDRLEGEGRGERTTGGFAESSYRRNNDSLARSAVFAAPVTGFAPTGQGAPSGEPCGPTGQSERSVAGVPGSGGPIAAAPRPNSPLAPQPDWVVGQPQDNHSKSGRT